MMRFSSLFGAVLLLTLVQRAPAQWVRTNGPFGGLIDTLVANRSTLYAGTHDGVFRSTDSGRTWDRAVTGGFKKYAVRRLLVSDSTIVTEDFAGRVYHTMPNSNKLLISSAQNIHHSQFTWFKGRPYIALTDGICDQDIAEKSWDFTDPHWILKKPAPLMATTSECFYTISRGKLYYSCDAKNWDSVTSLTDSLENLAVLNDLVLVSSVGHIYVFKRDIMKGSDFGMECAEHQKFFKWKDCFGSVVKFYANGKDIIAEVALPVTHIGHLFFHTIDSGLSWQKIEMLENEPGLLQNNDLGIRASIGELVFAGTRDGVFRSTDQGKTWKMASFGIPRFVQTLYSSGRTLFAISDWVLFRSSNNGVSWDTTLIHPHNSLLMDKIIGDAHNLFVGSESGLFHSTNDGLSWFADGSEWVPSSFQVRHSFRGPNWSIRGMTYLDSNFYLIPPGWQKSIVRSSDFGKTWITVLDRSEIDYSTWVSTLTNDGSNLFCGTHGGNYRSSDGGQHWLRVDSGNGSLYSIVRIGEILLAGTYNGVFNSTDCGLHWYPSSKGLAPRRITRKIVSNGQNVFAATDDGLFLSRDTGRSWIEVTGNIENEEIMDLVIKDGSLFVASNCVWRRDLSEFDVR